MKEPKTRTKFGDIDVIDPEQVVQLGLVMDTYKKSQRLKLWAEGEAHAVKQLGALEPMFYEESIDGSPSKNVTTEIRYYTPTTNIVLNNKENSDGKTH